MQNIGSQSICRIDFDIGTCSVKTLGQQHLKLVH